MPLKTNIKVIVSCSTKFWAFALAEQLEKHDMLHELYTSYSSIKNPLAKFLVSRRDKELISAGRIKTILPISFGLKLYKKPFFWNDLFDRWVARKIKKSDANVFIGWSGMSLRSIKVAKEKGMMVILERGSSHIMFQERILKEEFLKFSTKFQVDFKVLHKELKEYHECDYIAIPSKFVLRTFVDEGINQDKLVVNNYGASKLFKSKGNVVRSEKFVVLYLGALMIRKGMTYLFQALERLDIPEADYEVWFIGSIKEELQNDIVNYKKKNWLFKGHIDHSILPSVISQGSIAVVPSLEDGFGMVVPQMLECNIPVIVSENTGAADIIVEGKNGFIVPIRSSESIADRIKLLYDNPKKITEMKNFITSNSIDLSWDAYGDRYIDFLSKIML